MGKSKFNLYAFMRNNFIAGITALLPLWAVYFVVTFVANIVNDMWLNPLINLVTPYVSDADPEALTTAIKIVIVVVILLLIMMLGIVVKILFVRRFLKIGENMLMKVPLVNKVYVAMQQISRTFLVKKQAVFRQAVLVEYPHKGTYVLAFITSDARGEIQALTNKDLVSVFVPTTPNPTSGFLLFVPKDEIIALRMSIEDSFKLIISFGAVTPESPRIEA